MTIYKTHTMKCAVCGKIEEYQILADELDPRRTEIPRRILGDEIMVCPHCGYVAHDIESEVSSKVKEYVLSSEYQKRNIKGTNGKSVEAFEALRDILLHMGNRDGAFLASMKAAHMADDSGQPETAEQIRERTLEILFTKPPYDSDNPREQNAQWVEDIQRDLEFFLQFESYPVGTIYGKTHEIPVLTPPDIPGTYFDYMTFHTPRSDKTELLYEDSVWPAEPFNNYWNNVYYINDGIMRIAMADGVSAASRYTKIWADLLTMRYYFKGEEILKNIVEYSKEWHKLAMKVVKDAYLPQDPEMYRHDKNEINTKGASTTFAGAEVDINNSTISIFTIGDTCFFLVRGDKCIAQVPNLNSPEKFTTHPHQIHDTDNIMEYEIERAEIPFENGDVIVGATDGVACWVVQPEEGWTIAGKLKALINCRSSIEFEELVEKERHTVIPTTNNTEQFAMHDDDSTVCVLRITKVDDDEQKDDYEELA